MPATPRRGQCWRNPPGDAGRPRVIVLGSLARRFGQACVEAVRESFAAEALRANSASTGIVPYALEDMQDLSPIAAAVYRLGVFPNNPGVAVT